MSLEKVRWDEFDKMHVVKSFVKLSVAGGRYRLTLQTKKAF